MEFALSEDQRLLQDSVKGFLKTASPLDTVRGVADGDERAGEAISTGLAGLGASQILIPERHGGLGLGLLDAVLVQEALGAAVSPAAFSAAAMACVGLEKAGTEPQQAEWLKKIASGDVRIGVAVTEQVGARHGAKVTASRGGLSGTSLFAQETKRATHVVVSDDEGRLHIVAMNAPGLARDELDTIDRTRDFARLTFDNVPSTMLNGENVAGAGAERMIRAGRMLIAADTLGAAQAMLDKAVAYALERKQFNRVIGGFQAVKHLCAQMAADIEPARALVWHAAHAVDEELDEADVMACLAKAHLAEVGTFVARTATEVHGGMGFTDLVGLHYWFKRIGANRQLLGGPERVREHAARLQGWT